MTRVIRTDKSVSIAVGGRLCIKVRWPSSVNGTSSSVTWHGLVIRTEPSVSSWLVGRL